METISKAANAVKDGYIRAVDWIEDNPQKTLWFATGALIVALVF